MTRLFLAAALVFAELIVSIPQSSAETIYACANNKSGSMRYVAGPNLCSKNETQMSWGVTGPQGPPGGFTVFDADNTEIGPLIGGLTSPFG